MIIICHTPRYSSLPRTALFVDNDDDDVLFNIDYYFLISIINKILSFFLFRLLENETAIVWRYNMQMLLFLG